MYIQLLVCSWNLERIRSQETQNIHDSMHRPKSNLFVKCRQTYISELISPISEMSFARGFTNRKELRYYMLTWLLSTPMWHLVSTPMWHRLSNDWLSFLAPKRRTLLPGLCLQLTPVT